MQETPVPVWVTSECPDCHQQFRRLCFWPFPVGATGLAICHDCEQKQCDELGRGLYEKPGSCR